MSGKTLMVDHQQHTGSNLRIAFANDRHNVASEPSTRYPGVTGEPPVTTNGSWWSGIFALLIGLYSRIISMNSFAVFCDNAN